MKDWKLKGNQPRPRSQNTEDLVHGNSLICKLRHYDPKFYIDLSCGVIFVFAPELFNRGEDFLDTLMQLIYCTDYNDR